MGVFPTYLVGVYFNLFTTGLSFCLVIVCTLTCQLLGAKSGLLCQVCRSVYLPFMRTFLFLPTLDSQLVPECSVWKKALHMEILVGFLYNSLRKKNKDINLSPELLDWK